ncbi:methyltransferase [Polaribacter haliotis]|uniref:tRNA1(Val) (adenine(37)-N6)-methyltransferase n=1 Tax=Polaribacter haliotis TaxID=1888915 RepID=A0A7L8AE66_9FLAO|nr:methyltransferase [Polaribacter haliotis]QOD60285.1 methyltransferase [Polaribacter haliotis]
MNKPFQFKEFTINQDITAMKIGTDGVLLGAWCAVDKYPDTILDIGSGTGVISLMIAQRSDAMTIDAVEVDENAYEQSVENFEQSDWGDRLYCYNATFQEFAEEISEEEETYDLIITNPPFYNDDFETENESRNKARFTSSLSFEELIIGVAKILSENGTFATIIPFKEEVSFINLAKENNLFLNRVCRVQGNETSEIKRSLLEFSFEQKEIKEENLIIETGRHQYTEQYINLVKDFYLKM